LNLLNRFDGGIETSMRKAAHPSGSVGSSNPRRWRGERLHNHGDAPTRAPHHRAENLFSCSYSAFCAYTANTHHAAMMS